MQTILTKTYIDKNKYRSGTRMRLIDEKFHDDDDDDDYNSSKDED